MIKAIVLLSIIGLSQGKAGSQVYQDYGGPAGGPHHYRHGRGHEAGSATTAVGTITSDGTYTTIPAIVTPYGTPNRNAYVGPIIPPAYEQYNAQRSLSLPYPHQGQGHHPQHPHPHHIPNGYGQGYGHGSGIPRGPVYGPPGPGYSTYASAFRQAYNTHPLYNSYGLTNRPGYNSRYRGTDDYDLIERYKNPQFNSYIGQEPLNPSLYSSQLNQQLLPGAPGIGPFNYETDAGLPVASYRTAAAAASSRFYPGSEAYSPFGKSFIRK